MPPFAATRRSTRPAPSELVKKVDESLVPRLSKLPGFSGYHLIEAGNGVMSSIGFFDTSAQADESTRVASDWVREREARDGAPERAEDHRRRGRRAQDARARPGVSRPSRPMRQRRPAPAGLLVAETASTEALGRARGLLTRRRTATTYRPGQPLIAGIRSRQLKAAASRTVSSERCSSAVDLLLPSALTCVKRGPGRPAACQRGPAFPWMTTSAGKPKSNRVRQVRALVLRRHQLCLADRQVLGRKIPLTRGEVARRSLRCVSLVGRELAPRLLVNHV